MEEKTTDQSERSYIDSPFTPDRLFRNPVMAAQALESLFVLDPYLGFTTPKGKEFFGEKEHLSIEECILEIKRDQKRVILNIGDSSTSGWDSNIVTINREREEENKPLLSTFFQYKTYSDYLRDLLGSDFFVINAGVPAHTSLQGYRRLRLLLKRFKEEKVKIELVTAYYGNNDSTWDHNRQDKDWIGRKNITKKKFVEISSGATTRILPFDYQKNISKIISTCQKFSVRLALIEPLTPIYWKPGTRVEGEDLERSYYFGSRHAYRYLDDALKLWNHMIDQDYSETKRLLLELAKEKDFVVPRIKQSHLEHLRKIASETETPYIQIDLDRTEDDRRYFIDYCHPIDKANEKIAKGIIKILNQLPKKKSKPLKKQINILQDDSKVEEEPFKVPIDHYALY